MSYFISFCEHLILLVIQLNRSSTVAPASNAHTYRLLIVKELVRYCLLQVDKAFCLSAAKKKEYEAFSFICQPLLYNFVISGDPFLLRFAASLIGEANYSKAWTCWQGLFSRSRIKLVQRVRCDARHDALSLGQSLVVGAVLA